MITFEVSTNCSATDMKQSVVYCICQDVEMHNLSGISNIQTNMFQIEHAYLQQMLEMTSVMNYEVYTEA